MTARVAVPRPAAAETIALYLRRLIEPGAVTELRALHYTHPGGRHAETVAGFFDYDHLDAMAAAAHRLSPCAVGVYFLLNPADPALLSRRCNKVGPADKGLSAGDDDILRRRWLPIDVDPRRKSGISATAAERLAAKRVTWKVHQHLKGRGWPDPVIGDSGNGFHLLYRIDQPADDGGRVQRCLEALAARFDTPAAAVDVAVANPGRIWKLYGTVARKGDSTPDRPHRLTDLILPWEMRR
jgi:hypothetical protein